MISYISLLLFGFIVGCLVSMFGGGGGFFFVPVLTLLFKIPTQTAIATSLASIIPTTLTASLSHYKRGNLNIAIGIILGIGGIIGAYIGAYISSQFTPDVLKKVFGLFMFVMGVQMYISTKRRAVISLRKTSDQQHINKTKVITGFLFGLLSGIMAGLFGLSGTPPIIAGLYFLGLPVNVVVGTSVFVLMFNAISGLISHLLAGHLNILLALLLATGSASGAYVGPVIMDKLKKETLEKVYGHFFTLLVFFMAVMMIIK